MRMHCGVLAIALLAGRLSAGEAPEVVLSPAGLELRRLPPVLWDEVVARHLDTGLTTTLVVSVDCGSSEGGKLEGQAQLRIRYDLWDERYVLKWDDARAKNGRVVVSRADLRGWWRSLSLLVLSGSGAYHAPKKAKVTLVVLPFSSSEQRETQDWLLRSMGGGEAAPARRGEERSAAGGPLISLYSSMLAASIGRRSLISYAWTVAVTAESP